MPSLLFTFSIYVAFHYRLDGNWIALAGVRFTCNKMSDPTMVRLCYWVLISTNQCEFGIQMYSYALSEKKSLKATHVNTAAAPIQCFQNANICIALKEKHTASKLMAGQWNGWGQEKHTILTIKRASSSSPCPPWQLTVHPAKRFRKLRFAIC